VKIHLEGERSFLNYKRIHWVVCKTQEKKRLRDFRESFEKERKGQQVGCISQGILGTFPKYIFCVKLLSYLMLLEVVPYKFVQSIQQGRGHDF
jgi:hypothetical protein